MANACLGSSVLPGRLRGPKGCLSFCKPGGRKDLRREMLSSWPSGSLTQPGISKFNSTQGAHQLPPVTVHCCCTEANSPPPRWRKWVPHQAWETETSPRQPPRH